MDTFFTEIFIISTSWLVVIFIAVTKDYSSGGNTANAWSFWEFSPFVAALRKACNLSIAQGIFHPELSYWKYGHSRNQVNFLGGCWGSTGQVFLFQSNTLLSCPGVKLLCIQSGAKSQCPQSQVRLVEKWPQPVTPSPVQRAKMIPWGMKPVSGWQSGVHWYSLRERDRLREPVQVVCRRITWPNAGE